MALYMWLFGILSLWNVHYHNFVIKNKENPFDICTWVHSYVLVRVWALTVFRWHIVIKDRIYVAPEFVLLVTDEITQKVLISNFMVICVGMLSQKKSITQIVKLNTLECGLKSSCKHLQHPGYKKMKVSQCLQKWLSANITLRTKMQLWKIRSTPFIRLYRISITARQPLQCFCGPWLEMKQCVRRSTVNTRLFLLPEWTESDVSWSCGFG